MACRDALQQRRPEELAALMTENFRLRRQMFGDAVIGPRNLHMVDLVQSVGGERLQTATLLTAELRQGCCEESILP